MGEREKKDNKGKKQWKKNGKLKLCNKAPPILRRDHHYFLCKWPQGFQSFLSLTNTPEASVNTIKRVRFIFLSKQVGVRRFATIFGFTEGSWSQEMVEKLPKQKCSSSEFYSINGRLENTDKTMAWSFSLSFTYKKRKDGENIGRRMLHLELPSRRPRGRWEDRRGCKVNG